MDLRDDDVLVVAGITDQRPVLRIAGQIPQGLRNIAEPVRRLFERAGMERGMQKLAGEGAVGIVFVEMGLRRRPLTVKTVQV